MPPAHPSIPPAAEPARKIFDPWNSSSTGHQTAQNRLSGSTSWRHSRTAKLRNQFTGGAGGGKRMFDSVGAGSREWGRDGRKENGDWEKGAPGLREPGSRDILSMMVNGSRAEMEALRAEEMKKEEEFPETRLNVADEAGGQGLEREKHSGKLFQGLTFYINGSTAPAISDHKLKQLISEHGGKMALGLARRSVTHVIVGRPNGISGGAGGGLSGSKIEKEVQRTRGCGVKFVNVEWVIESMKAGKRLSEYRFSGVNTAPNGVRGVATMFKSQEKKCNSGAALEKKTTNDG